MIATFASRILQYFILLLLFCRNKVPFFFKWKKKKAIARKKIEGYLCQLTYYFNYYNYRSNRLGYLTHPKKPTGPESTTTQFAHFGIDNRPLPLKSMPTGQMVCFLLQNPSNLNRPTNQAFLGEICQFQQDLC